MCNQTKTISLTFSFFVPGGNALPKIFPEDESKQYDKSHIPSLSAVHRFPGHGWG